MAVISVRPTHAPPKTLRQSKAEYKKFGPRISSQQSRQTARAVELYDRAQKIKEAEKRRKAAQKRKLEKEQRERETRKRLNIADPMPYVSQHQMRLGDFVQRIHEESSDDKTELWDDDDLDEDILQATDKIAKQPERRSQPRQECSSLSLTRQSTSDFEDDWENLLVSNTQIERELDVKDSPVERGKDLVADIPMSTQDVDFTAEDLEELGLDDSPVAKPKISPASKAKKDLDHRLMPPPPPPLARHSKVTSKPPETLDDAEDNLLEDLSASDFDLSSQDFREISC